MIHHFVCFLRYCKGLISITSRNTRRKWAALAKTGLLGNSADGKLGGLQQLLRGLDAAVVQVVHDGLPGHPPEQAAEIVGER